MKDVRSTKVREALFNRIDNISSENKPLWGKMNAEQMICHLTDQVRVALGKKETKDTGNWATKNIVKHLIMAGMKAPKGKVKTMPEIDQVVGKGTKPTSLAHDKESLKQEIIAFISVCEEGEKLRHHPIFGKMTQKQWAILITTHIDHHLRQFDQ